MTAQPQDVRQQILHEATRLFVDRGYHGLSMREIAEAVGVSKAGLYYHFKDKEDLFLAILTNNLDRLEQTIQQAQQAPTVRAQVVQFVTEIFQWAPEQRAIIRLASQEMDHLSQHGVAEFTRLYHAKFIGQIQAMLAAGDDVPLLLLRSRRGDGRFRRGGAVDAGDLLRRRLVVTDPEYSSDS